MDKISKKFMLNVLGWSEDRANYIIDNAGFGQATYDRSTFQGDPSKFNKAKFTLARKVANLLTGVANFKLLTANTRKMEKSNSLGMDLSVIMHLAPARLSGYNTCPGATEGCMKSCLNTSGQGRYSLIHARRIRKTRLFFEHRELFLTLLFAELAMWRKRAAKKGLGLAVRLNGTSDIRWELVAPWIGTVFSDVNFYDYTKLGNRKGLPANYSITHSYAEDMTTKGLKELVRRGRQVAVVFSPDIYDVVMEHGKYKGLRVIDGYHTDRRFAEEGGVVVALKALGQAIKDTSGFVVREV